MRAPDFFFQMEKNVLLGSALNEQAAGLASFSIRSDGSAFLPPTPSCRAVLAVGGGDYIYKYHDGL
jgi:hypothetical protein